MHAFHHEKLQFLLQFHQRAMLIDKSTQDGNSRGTQGSVHVQKVHIERMYAHQVLPGDNRRFAGVLCLKTSHKARRGSRTGRGKGRKDS